MISMKTFQRSFASDCDGNWTRFALAFFAVALCLVWTAIPASAQTAGDGSIEGTVMDTTGSVIPGAAVTITNVATGISTVQKSSSAGFFNIAPVLPGTYKVQVTAKGFKTLVQDNVVVNALQVRAISPVLSVGAESQTVTVTGAPPVLDTADATIETTIQNATYSDLPIQMNGGQRDPTHLALSLREHKGAHGSPSLAERGTTLGSFISTVCRPRPSASRATTGSSR